MTLNLHGVIGRGAHSLPIDLSVVPGEVVGVVGPNGCGKTTLIETIAGLLPLISGELKCDQVVWDSPSQKKWLMPEQRTCSVVFQDVRLFPHMTVLQNVMFGLRSQGMKKSEASTIAGECLLQVGMAQMASRSAANLSGGEAQRVALARAIATQPRVLLLDEPFSAIDATSRNDLREVVAEIVQGFEGMTLLVSHDSADLASLAGRTIALGG